MSVLVPLKAKVIAALLSAMAVGGTVVGVSQPWKEEATGTARDSAAAIREARAGAIGTVTGAKESPGPTAASAAEEAQGSSASASIYGSPSGSAPSAGASVGAKAAGNSVNTGIDTGTAISNVPPLSAPDTSSVTGLVPQLPDPSTIGVPIPAVPVGDGLAAYDHGSYSVIVPGTTGVSKQLCLSGEVSKCAAISVPALEPTTLTVSYSSNISPTPPTFTPGFCAGGVTVTLGGLTPGATVTVSARGYERTLVVPAKDMQQTASLCD